MKRPEISLESHLECFHLNIDYMAFQNGFCFDACLRKKKGDLIWRKVRIPSFVQDWNRSIRRRHDWYLRRGGSRDHEWSENTGSLYNLHRVNHDAWWIYRVPVGGSPAWISRGMIDGSPINPIIMMIMTEPWDANGYLLINQDVSRGNITTAWGI